MLVGQVSLEIFPGGPVTLVVLKKGVFIPNLQNTSVWNNKTKEKQSPYHRFEQSFWHLDEAMGSGNQVLLPEQTF
jgi:hypothetical protein